MNLDWRDNTGPCKQTTILIDNELIVCRQLSFAPLYAISNTGDAISFAREFPRILKPARTQQYKIIAIGINGKFKTIPLHQLTCFAFHGARPTPNHLVRHLDGDPDNNNADNLQWGTYAENHEDKIRHAAAHGLTTLISQSEAVKYGKQKIREARTQRIIDLFDKQTTEPDIDKLDISG